MQGGGGAAVPSPPEGGGPPKPEQVQNSRHLGKLCDNFSVCFIFVICDIFFILSSGNRFNV